MEVNMRTEKLTSNVPVDILASLKIGAGGLEKDKQAGSIPADYR